MVHRWCIDFNSFGFIFMGSRTNIIGTSSAWIRECHSLGQGWNKLSFVSHFWEEIIRLFNEKDLGSVIVWELNALTNLSTLKASKIWDRTMIFVSHPVFNSNCFSLWTWCLGPAICGCVHSLPLFLHPPRSRNRLSRFWQNCFPHVQAWATCISGFFKETSPF